MSKRSHKYAADKNAAQKRKRKNQDKHRWRNFAAWAIPFIFVPLGFTFSTETVRGVLLSVVTWIIYFWYVVILLERYIYREAQQRHVLRIAVLLLTLLMFPVWFVWNRKSSQHFIAKTHFFYVKKPETLRFLLNDKDAKPQCVFPVGIMADVEITNLRSTATKITRYWADVGPRFAFGPFWTRLRGVEIRDPLAICMITTTEPSVCKRFDLTENSFDLLAQKEDLPPGKTIKGFLFFALPPELDPASIREFRMTVENSQGEQETVFPSTPRPESGAISLTRVNLRIAASECCIDISGIQECTYLSEPHIKVTHSN